MTEPNRDNKNLDLMLSRVMPVPPEIVWKAWTEPAHLKKWWAPAPWTVDVDILDVRPGGVFRSTMHSPEGGGFSGESVFLEVLPNQKLVFSDALQDGWRPSQSPFFTVIVQLERLERGTHYTVRVLHKDEADRKKHEDMGFFQGWSTCLDQLTEVASRLNEANGSAFTLTIQRQYHAPPERVFDAWLDPKTIGEWLFATPDGTMKRVELDPRPGGAYCIEEERPDGTWTHTGEYTLLERPNRLAFTLKVNAEDEPSLVRIEIVATETGCVLTLTHEMNAKWKEHEARAREGWNAIFDGLQRMTG